MAVMKMTSVPERILAAHRSWKSCALKFPRAMRQRPVFWINPPAMSSNLPYFPVKWRRSILHRSPGDSVAGSGHGQNLSDALKYATAK